MVKSTDTHRRNWLAITTGALAAGATLQQNSIADDKSQASSPTAARKGRIRQSVMGWCFKPMLAPDLAREGKRLGLVAIEGIDLADYPAAKQLGLEISLVSSHGFTNGPVNPDNHAMVETKLRQAIDNAVKFGAKRVITFTGMRVPGILDDASKRNCLNCWKRVIKDAEDKEVTLCLEHLNSRDSTHPMKGHPGYFGDDVELCIELVKHMDSPQFKLLFDIYHVQIMNGDVIRRIREHHPFIGHYHTAGNPGRGEIDESQEINYPPIMKAILETGFDGYVAQEFIPTWSDPLKALDHAIGVCDV